MIARISVAIVFFGLLAFAIAKDEAEKKSPADVSTAETIDGHYIPKDLDDCFKILEKRMGPNGVKELEDGKEDDLPRYHLSLGMGLRNQWGLWRGSRLAKYFYAMGISNPEDMSGIILTSFWRHLHGQPLKLKEQIAADQEYAKQAEAMEKQMETHRRERSEKAKAVIPGMMMGWTLEKSKLPAVTMPPRHYITDELRARFLAPFRGGAFLTVRGEQLPNTEDWTTVGYFLDPQDEKLHHILVPEIPEITSALTIGEAAWFAGKAKGKPVLVKVAGTHHSTIALPSGQSEPPELGIGQYSLLLVYPHAVYREKSGDWEKLYSGELTLRRSGPPPRLFGSHLCFRDEGHGEGGKCLQWLDLTANPHLGTLQDELGAIAPFGGEWSNTLSYSLTFTGDIWSTLGESVIERSNDGTYHIGIIAGCLQFDPKMTESWLWEAKDIKISGLLAHDGQITMAGNTGLYRLADKAMVQVVAFTNTAQDLSAPGEKVSFHWVWNPSDLLLLGDEKWLISGTFGGIYLLEHKSGMGYEFRCVDDPVGKNVIF